MLLDRAIGVGWACIGLGETRVLLELALLPVRDTPPSSGDVPADRLPDPERSMSPCVAILAGWSPCL